MARPGASCGTNLRWRYATHARTHVCTATVAVALSSSPHRGRRATTSNATTSTCRHSAPWYWTKRRRCWIWVSPRGTGIHPSRSTEERRYPGCSRPPSLAAPRCQAERNLTSVTHSALETRASAKQTLSISNTGALNVHRVIRKRHLSIVLAVTTRQRTPSYSANTRPPPLRADPPLLPTAAFRSGAVGARLSQSERPTRCKRLQRTARGPRLYRDRCWPHDRAST